MPRPGRQRRRSRKATRACRLTGRGLTFIGAPILMLGLFMVILALVWTDNPYPDYLLFGGIIIGIVGLALIVWGLTNKASCIVGMAGVRTTKKLRKGPVKKVT